MNGADDPSIRTTTIRPAVGWPGLDLKEVWRYRSLCLVLTRRLLKVRYRQTVIGVGWAVGQPLMLMVMFSIVFGALARLPTEGIPFPVFYFCGLAVWGVVTKVLTEGTLSITSNAALVDRVYFPRVYLPISVALSSVVDLLFNGLALIVMLLLFDVRPTTFIVLTPLLIAIAYMTSLGVAMWLGALNVEYRDVTVVLPVFVQLWFFATPIIYPASIVPPQWELLYYANPMALVVTGIRAGFAGTPPPPVEAWPVSMIVAVLLFVIGYLFFRRRAATFADIV